MTPLGVAVIGCGFQGAIHAGNVAASPRAVLISCVDLDRERAEELASSFGARASDRLSDVWDDPAVDAVVIATTTHTHHDLALAAAAHGKHMLLEKPMAMSLNECLAIERACEEAGVITVMGYKFRFTEAVVAAKTAVPRPQVLVAHTLYDPAPSGSHAWVNDRSKSGGRLVSSLVHSADLLRFLAGDEVVRVYAEGAQISHPSLDEADTVTATLLFQNGAIGSIVHGTAASSALLSTWSFQTADVGVNATIHDHGRRLSLRRELEEDTVVIDPVKNPFEAGTDGLLDALVSAVSGERVDVPGPRDGTVSLLLSRCIEQGIETGQPVTVPAL